MNWKEILRLSFESIKSNRLRSFLTMLGMMIGVFAVVTLVSLGQGAKNYVLNEFQNLGTNLIVVQPGKTDDKGSLAPPIGSSEKKMTLQDVYALEKRAFYLEAVTGLVLGSATVRLGEAVSNVQVFGANEQFPNILNVKIGQGSYFAREDEITARRVVVIGRQIALNLFGNENAIGQAVKINQSEFRVVGVIAPMGQKLGLNFDQLALIPTSAALRLFNEDKLFGIRAKASARVAIDDAVYELTEILKERHSGKEDFTVVTQVSMIDTMSTILNMLTYVLSGIAAVSMLVGGIGIMNIMLVSVTERIPEIGLRRAVGARRRDILKQFLFEAVTLSVLSGGIGLLGSIALTSAMRIWLPNFDMRAPTWILFPAFAMSVAVGVVFGVWPARKAAAIEPLDALRHE